MASSSMAVDSKGAPTRPKIDVDGYLARAASSTPASLAPYFQAFGDLHHRKLWHQLTDKLFAFSHEPSSAPYRVDVFENFVLDFESRMNPLRLVELAVIASKEIDNPERLITFLTSLSTRLPESTSPAAHVLLIASRARARLLFGDTDGTRTDLDDAQRTLDGLGTVEPRVNAAYYGVRADLHKARAEYGPYYRHALLYLACVTLADLPADERRVRAHDLALAALLGDSIYNFGELLVHPILGELAAAPEHVWLRDLLLAFNEGSIGKFEALAPRFPAEPILQQNYPFLRQKICLMALIESVFRRDAYDRTLSFATIATETRLPVDEVEHLLMKALSLKLIRGTLDQVAGTASISWVQPRVLGQNQIGELAVRLDKWCKRLGEVENRVSADAVGAPAGLSGATATAVGA